MNEVHTQPESSISNGHDANGTAGQGRNGVPANALIPDYPAEILELFQMPPAPMRRILGRVHKVGPAPFVFVDELAE